MKITLAFCSSQFVLTKYKSYSIIYQKLTFVQESNFNTSAFNEVSSDLTGSF